MKEKSKVIIEIIDGVKSEMKVEGKRSDIEFSLNGVVIGVCEAVKRLQYEDKAEEQAVYMALLNTFFNKSGIDIDKFAEKYKELNAEEDKKPNIDELKQKAAELLKKLLG